MMPLHRHILIGALKLFDLLLMALSYLVATWISASYQFPPSLDQVLSFPIAVKEIIYFLSLLLAWHIGFVLLGLYRSRRISIRRQEAIDILKAVSVGTFILFILGKCSGIGMVGTLFLGVFWVTSATMGILGRLLLRWGLGWVRIRGRNLRFVLIIGTDDRAISLARLIESHGRLGYCLTGFVRRNGEGIRKAHETGYPVVSDFKGFPNFIRDRVVDEVWIGHARDIVEEELSQIVTFCRKCGIIIRYFAGPLGSLEILSRGMTYEDESVFTLHPGPVDAKFFIEKRWLDILGSMALLVFLSPLFLVAAVMIKITSPGPIFFVQERIGLNRRKFRLHSCPKTVLKESN